MFFIALFTMEMVLKMYSLGFQVSQIHNYLIFITKLNITFFSRVILYRYLIVLIVLLLLEVLQKQFLQDQI